MRTQNDEINGYQVAIPEVRCSRLPGNHVIWNSLGNQDPESLGDRVAGIGFNRDSMTRSMMPCPLCFNTNVYSPYYTLFWGGKPVLYCNEDSQIQHLERCFILYNRNLVIALENTHHRDHQFLQGHGYRVRIRKGWVRKAISSSSALEIRRWVTYWRHKNNIYTLRSLRMISGHQNRGGTRKIAGSSPLHL